MNLYFFCDVVYQVTNYLLKIAPDLCDRVELYSKKTPLFDEYKIEEEINSILSKRLVKPLLLFIYFDHVFEFYSMMVLRSAYRMSTLPKV